MKTKVTRTRRVAIEWSWGRAAYHLRFDDVAVSVTQPDYNRTNGENLFRFNWIDEDRYEVIRNSSVPRIDVTRNGVITARLFPSTKMERFCNAKLALLDSNESLELKHLTVFGIPKGMFSIVGTNGRRYAYWRIQSCRWGGPSAIMLVRSSIPQASFPVLLAVAVSTIVSYSTTGGA